MNKVIFIALAILVNINISAMIRSRVLQAPRLKNSVMMKNILTHKKFKRFETTATEANNSISANQNKKIMMLVGATATSALATAYFKNKHDENCRSMGSTFADEFSSGSAMAFTYNKALESQFKLYCSLAASCGLGSYTLLRILRRK